MSQVAYPAAGLFEADSQSVGTALRNTRESRRFDDPRDEQSGQILGDDVVDDARLRLAKTGKESRIDCASTAQPAKTCVGLAKARNLGSAADVLARGMQPECKEDVDHRRVVGLLAEGGMQPGQILAGDDVPDQPGGVTLRNDCLEVG